MKSGEGAVQRARASAKRRGTPPGNQRPRPGEGPTWLEGLS